MGSNTFVQADVWTVAQTDQGNVVLIRPKESDLVVPIFIGQLETQSILIGLGRVEMPRPLTHDLLISVLGALGAELAKVEIRDLRDKTFFANVVIKASGEEMIIDARPSDAIALAVRCHAEVYIAEDIVETAGVPVDMIRENSAAEEPPPEDEEPVITSIEVLDADGPEAKRAILSAELEAAIVAEDYETAASIRDKLRELP